MDMLEEETLGGRGPTGDYLEKRAAIERAIGNWVCGERGYAWEQMRQLLEKHYQAVPFREREAYKAMHTETMMALANCESIEKSGADPKDLFSDLL